MSDPLHKKFRIVYELATDEAHTPNEVLRKFCDSLRAMPSGMAMNARIDGIDPKVKENGDDMVSPAIFGNQQNVGIS